MWSRCLSRRWKIFLNYTELQRELAAVLGFANRKALYRIARAAATVRHEAI